MLLELVSNNQPTDDPDIYDGAHVAVQLIGRRLQEEKVLALAEHIGEAISRK